MLENKRNEYFDSEYSALNTHVSKRYCFKTPEGKFVYACARSETDSFMIANSEKEYKEYASQDYFNLKYLEENIDFPIEPDIDPIEMYIINRKIYAFLLIIVTIINTTWSVYSLSTTQSVVNTIFQISKIYYIPYQLMLIIYMIIYLDLFLSMIVFITGLFSLCTSKSKLLNTHSLLAIVSMILVILRDIIWYCIMAILLWYVHQIYFLAFIIRIMLYVYARYMVSLLHSILLLPIQG